MFLNYNVNLIILEKKKRFLKCLPIKPLKWENILSTDAFQNYLNDFFDCITI